MMLRAVWIAALLAGCAAEDVPAGSDEPSDFDPVDWSPDGKADFSGVPAAFDHDAIVDNQVFAATAAVDGDAVQAFLEHTPYGNRSWLADYTLSGERFADRLVAIARADGVDPVMLLVRLQVESSIIGKTVQPSNSTLTHATGCGCPDTGGCSATLSGFENQIQCAADTYAKGFADSQHGTGQWRASHAEKTLDGITVTPLYDATASIYAYTPWVLVNRGGAWLTWNVTRLYLKHFDQAGTLHLP